MELGKAADAVKSLNEFNQRKLLALAASLREACEAYPEPGLAEAVEKLGFVMKGRLVARSGERLREFLEAEGKVDSMKERKALSLVGDRQAREIISRMKDVKAGVKEYLLCRLLGMPECCTRSHLAKEKGFEFPLVPWKSHGRDCAESVEFNEKMKELEKTFIMPGKKAL